MTTTTADRVLLTADPYDEATTSATFDPLAYLASFDTRLLAVPAGRRALTRTDPILHALVYHSKHLTDPQTGTVTFSDAHLAWARVARTWMGPNGQREGRHAFIAPRQMGKSTWAFLLLPMWAAAHGWSRFAFAVAHSATQAETHLQTFRTELTENALLRTDFSTLCQSFVRGGSGSALADNRTMIRQNNGFVFSARGIDSGILGVKVDAVRPDLLVMDDIEPSEANYSTHQRKQRLSTLQNVVLQLNETARVLLVGTVTMPGSITHALVAAAAGREVEPWIVDERFEVHHTRPILDDDAGGERSVWPGRWSLDYLQSIRGTRVFLMNFENDPRAYEGAYWRAEDFRYGPVPGCTRSVLSIDPAVTTKEKSDQTGVAVVSWAPTDGGRCLVEHAEGVRLQPGEPLRQHVLALLVRHPAVREVVVETNQGGDAWRGILHDLPVRVRTVHQSAAKAVRAAQALSRYQQGRVVHARAFPTLEDQMIAFNGSGRTHDDILDAVGTAVLGFLPDEDGARRRPQARRA